MEYKEGMTLKEFVASKRKRGKTKLPADYSVGDYFQHYRHSVWRYQGGLTVRGTRRKRMAKNSKWNISKSQFRKILSSINSLLLEATLQGEDIKLPVDFGIIYARQKPIYTKLDEEGNLKTNRAINWKETLNLWFEDKEARENKQLVYQDNCTAKPYMRMQFGDFTNKRFLCFKPTHNVMRRVTRTMGKGELVLPNQGTSVKAIKDIQQ